MVDNAKIMTKISIQLFESFQRGDPESFVKIMDKLHSRVYGFTRKLIRSEPDAEELTQDVFLKLWENREHIKSNNSLISYLYMMTRNHVYDFMRRNRPITVSYDNSAIIHSAVPDVASEYEAKELDLLITLEVERMSPQRRRVFEMSIREGLSHDEIAEKLKITNKTVSNHLYYVLSKLEDSFLLSVGAAILSVLSLRFWI